jgi:phosphoribosylaminoimidazole-succinocarboxamide synthase
MDARVLISETSLPDMDFMKHGKVRDIYDFGDTLLIVATDRICAFDVVMDDPIPDKGRILTQISAFWFSATDGIIANHMISTSAGAFPPEGQPHREILEGGSMWVRKADPLPVECIVRGYLAGSGLKEYRQTGAICGIGLPPGLWEFERLPQPIFTPSTKAEGGAHDINISFDVLIKSFSKITWKEFDGTSSLRHQNFPRKL